MWPLSTVAIRFGCARVSGLGHEASLVFGFPHVDLQFELFVFLLQVGNLLLDVLGLLQFLADLVFQAFVRTLQAAFFGFQLFQLLFETGRLEFYLQQRLG